MMNRRIDPLVLRQQIDLLLTEYPDLVDDEVLRHDMIEAETNVHSVMRTLEQKRQDAAAMVLALAKTIDDYRKRQDRLDHREKGIRGMMKAIMDLAQLRKLEMAEATFTIRAGTPRVLIVDETQLPKEYTRTRIEPAKDLIKQAIANGEDVAGASLSNAPDTLSIRVK